MSSMTWRLRRTTSTHPAAARATTQTLKTIQSQLTIFQKRKIMPLFDDLE